jgi:signal transduction histidine kinase
MPSSATPSAQSKHLARVAVIGMSLAVVALGSLSVWAAIVTQNGAQGLSRAGVQTSGHLRAVQALSLIDTSTDALEERIVPADLRKLRTAQRVLDEALNRMESGGVIEASQLAGRAKPMIERLKPAIERFLAKPPGFDSDGSSGTEEEMEDIISELSVLLNDLDSDPSQLLATQLASVTATERTVRVTAFVLIPLGLSGVAVCAWLLSLYRRRAEATMRGALNAVIEDITDKARLERQQQESQRLEAVGRLAGGIAHDFNNLLTGVVGHAELIRTADSAAEVEESVDVILEASDRAASLVRQLLTFSRQQEFRSEEIDTPELLRRTAKLLRRILGSSVVIDLQIDDAAPSIVADPSQIDQVLLNLAVNARDAMPAGGTLSLSVGRLSADESWTGYPGVEPSEYCRILVSDTGVGMSEETVARIFQPFFTTKDVGQGTGLGLAITHGIIARADGHLFVTSVLGEGTAFEILLPAADTEGEHRTERLPFITDRRPQALQS